MFTPPSHQDRMMETTRFQLNAIEIAARNVDRAFMSDNSSPNFLESPAIALNSVATCSGLTDQDYPNVAGPLSTLSNMSQVKLLNKVPLPPEVMENFNHMQCHCLMGLFPEISRAWLTIDSDIYIWTYEHGTDVAYFDGLSETIVSVGLVKPKPGVFHSFIKYLLVLTTSVDIIVLGVTFFSSSSTNVEEIQLVPDPVFTIPTDGATITCIAGDNNGRLFLGSKDGSLYEIVYQAESSWFGKRCKKVNHSTSTLSFLLPTFLNAALSDEDPIVDISIDNSRYILYVLTEKGSIEVYDMGEKGQSLYRVIKISQASLVHQAMNVVKTLDSSNFRPIVSISAIESLESSYANIVAVTQNGVRLYLTTFGLNKQNSTRRPYTLQLMHVRIPPGFSANVNTAKPRNVHKAHFREGTLMLLSTINDRDILWCLSSDTFPFSPYLTEAYTTLSLDGPAWAMTEVQTQNELIVSKTSLAPPLVVRQHIEPPRKYVILTAQGATVLLKLRPVDLLRQLLVDNHGPDSDHVKAFFTALNNDQACATCLILACLESAHNADVCEWATRAFFMYGGEPKIAGVSMSMHQLQQQQHQQHQQQQQLQMSTVNLNQTPPPHLGTSIFAPGIVSTPVASPYSVMNQSQMMGSTVTSPNLSMTGAGIGVPSPSFIQQTAQHQQQHPSQSQQIHQDMFNSFHFSSKHNGLYLYLSRILRPIWNLSCVSKVNVDNKEFLTSVVKSDDCSWILGHLLALRSFLQRNTHLCLCLNPASLTQQQNHPDLVNSAILQQQQHHHRLPSSVSLKDAQLEERQSLDALKLFVTHCCEVLGLWRIICEHQCHILINSLPQNNQSVLLNMAFKDLLLFGNEICSSLIVNLINSYLGDNASVDSISAKLREVCPHLYKNEDAACSKANEILKNSKLQANVDERESMLNNALQLCKGVAPNINLPEICQQFVGAQYYHAVTELCVTCAKKVDPENVALHYYKKSDLGDQDAYQYYAKRMEMYKEVLNMLDTLYMQNAPVTVEGHVQGNVNVTLDSSTLTKRVINDILETYNEELLHVAIYQWMMSKHLYSDLINIRSPTLESFLVKSTSGPQQDSSVHIYDLLWKLYEKNNNHSAAAKVLHSLAIIPGPKIPLKQRLAYLARAVMCMRSDKVGYAPHLGVFLRELEDQIQITKVQEMILDSLNSLRPSHPRAAEAVEKLNCSLFEITQLYEEFAAPFQLWDCQLAIIDCSGHSDKMLVHTIWQNIVQSELKKCTGLAEDKMSQLLTKVAGLAKLYKSSENCFPVSYVVQLLEVQSCNLKVDPAIVPNAFVNMGLPIEDLVSIYNNLILQSDRLWMKEGDEFHIYKAISALMIAYLNRIDHININDKRKITAKCQDIVSSLLSNLYSKQNTEQLIQIFRNIQGKLSRL